MLPHFNYCSTVWHPCNEKLPQSIESVQNYSMRIILNKPQTPSAPLREQLKWTTLHQHRHTSTLYQVHRCLLGMLPPPYLSSKFVRNSTNYDRTRGADKIHLCKPNNEVYRKSFEYYGALQYNQLPKVIRDLHVWSATCVIDYMCGRLHVWSATYVIDYICGSLRLHVWL